MSEIMASSHLSRRAFLVTAALSAMAFGAIKPASAEQPKAVYGRGYTGGY